MFINMYGCDQFDGNLYGVEFGEEDAGGRRRGLGDGGGGLDFIHTAMGNFPDYTCDAAKATGNPAVGVETNSSS